jgi:hypothetical protein
LAFNLANKKAPAEAGAFEFSGRRKHSVLGYDRAAPAELVVQANLAGM